MFELKRFDECDINKVYEFFYDLESENGYENYFFHQDYETFITVSKKEIEDYAHGINLKEGHVPSSKYFLFKDGVIVGTSNIRHYLNAYLREGPGHIGYCIKKEYRGFGYATILLKLTIEKLVSMDYFNEKEIYLEANKDNLASQRVMIKNGAYFHHANGNKVLYRIKVKQ